MEQSKRLIVYIAGKYAAPTKQEVKENIRVAEQIAIQALRLGFVPIIPHKITSFFDLVLTDWKPEDWLERFCFPLIEKSDVLLLCNGWETSNGALQEAKFALQRGKGVMPALDFFKAFRID